MDQQARDLIDQGNALVTQRSQLEQTWDYICRLMFPTPDRQFRRGGVPLSRDLLEGWAAGNKIAERARLIYDNTALIALERMTAGCNAMITPENEKWQGITAGGSLGYELNDEETRWAERQRDYLFKVRYNPASGWALAHYNALRSAAALGTGIYLLEEDWKTPVDIPYVATTLPLSENYLTTNAQGLHDQDFRFWTMSARNVAERFPNCSGKVKLMAEDPVQKHRLVQLLHYIGEGKGSGLANQKHSSIVIEVDESKIIHQGGFNYWPIIAYLWNQFGNAPYGEGACALVLAEVAGTNILAKNALLAAQQHTRPPVAMADDSTMNRPNLNPAAINFNAIDSNGRLKIQPIVTASNPQLSQVVLDASRTQINNGLYTNLWQVLLDNPKMTATQALIRNNEKGELLSPIGASIQRGLARLTDSELDILVGKGAWAEGSPLQPPSSLGGKSPGTKFASPLDRLRRSNELIGIKSTLEVAAELAAVDKESADYIDGEETLRLTREISGAPASMMKTKEQVAQIRQARQATNAAQQAAMLAKEAGPGVKAIADATKTATETPMPDTGAMGDMLAQLGVGAG